MASACIQWWALTLASYEYTIKYKSGSANSNADALSHLHYLWPFFVVPVLSGLVLLMERMWSFPDRLWSTLHMDYAGPMDKHMLLVVVGAFSKWIDVFPVKSASWATTIARLRTVFANHGIPEAIWPCTSAEMKEFLTASGVQQITSSPYHPSSNGLAEHAARHANQHWKNKWIFLRHQGSALFTEL